MLGAHRSFIQSVVRSFRVMEYAYLNCNMNTQYIWPESNSCRSVMEWYIGAAIKFDRFGCTDLQETKSTLKRTKIKSIRIVSDTSEHPTQTTHSTET